MLSLSAACSPMPLSPVCVCVCVYVVRQWADTMSLGLLRLLFEQSTHTLLFIGAYRVNEVDEQHPLIKLTTQLAIEAPERVQSILLKPITEAHCTTLVCDTFNCSPEVASPFAGLLHHQTTGNPFFLGQRRERERERERRMPLGHAAF